MFSPLGVVVEFTQATKGNIQVYGKPSRVKEVVTTVKGFLKAGAISGHEASSLDGEGSFLEGGPLWPLRGGGFEGPQA